MTSIGPLCVRNEVRNEVRNDFQGQKNFWCQGGTEIPGFLKKNQAPYLKGIFNSFWGKTFPSQRSIFWLCCVDLRGPTHPQNVKYGCMKLVSPSDDP